MIIFGGFINGERTNSVFRFIFNENRWENITPNNNELMSPSPRAGHSAALHGNNMIIFGGRDEDNAKLNDLWIFDT
jgi:hypothetical protein